MPRRAKRRGLREIPWDQRRAPRPRPDQCIRDKDDGLERARIHVFARLSGQAGKGDAPDRWQAPGPRQPVMRLGKSDPQA